MNLRQWDLVKVRINPQDRDEHPAIILSPTEVADDDRWPKVNVIYGTTKRPAESIAQDRSSWTKQTAATT